MSWSFAVPDWRERLSERRSLVPELPLWRDQADKAVAAFNRLRLADVPKNPAMETACGDWFRDIVAAVLGSVDPQTGARMVPELFALIGKKNSKTTNGAVLMLTALILNERPQAELLLIAPTKLIAELAFNQATGAIALDSYLMSRCHVQDHIKKITDGKTGAALQIKAFDPNVLTGCKPVAALFDELHLIGSAPEADRVIRQVRSGMISQPEAFLAFVTTQSEREPSGVFLRELKRARDVRDGKRADALLAVLYEFPEEIAKAKKDADGRYAWENPVLWPMVTPNLNRSIALPRMVSLYETAKLDGDSELLGWASQHLNIEIGLQNRVGAWNGAQYWAQNVEPGLTLETLLERCEVVTIGIDAGGSDDLFGLYVVGRLPTEESDGEEMADRRWLGWGHSWCNQKALDERKKESPRYLDFEKAGDLTIVPPGGDLLRSVADMVRRIDRTGKLAAIGLDRL
ncbi:hypothetical protein A1351_23240, partial [Methylosinus sp. R-45379]|uniref:terminase large subunit domain-containing protein n=1 Tax=Methylosinus sp. R-45379 TaxID=980563 RepID=UPI0007C97CAF